MSDDIHERSAHHDPTLERFLRPLRWCLHSIVDILIAIVLIPWTIVKWPFNLITNTVMFVAGPLIVIFVGIPLLALGFFTIPLASSVFLIKGSLVVFAVAKDLIYRYWRNLMAQSRGSKSAQLQEAVEASQQTNQIPASLTQPSELSLPKSTSTASTIRTISSEEAPTLGDSAFRSDFESVGGWRVSEEVPERETGTLSRSQSFKSSHSRRRHRRKLTGDSTLDSGRSSPEVLRTPMYMTNLGESGRPSTHARSASGTSSPESYFGRPTPAISTEHGEFDGVSLKHSRSGSSSSTSLTSVAKLSGHDIV